MFIVWQKQQGHSLLLLFVGMGVTGCVYEILRTCGAQNDRIKPECVILSKAKYRINWRAVLCFVGGRFFTPLVFRMTEYCF